MRRLLSGRLRERRSLMVHRALASRCARRYLRPRLIASRLLIQNSRYFLPKPMAASGKSLTLEKAQRCEHSGIKPLGDHKVAHRDGDVVDHEALT
jgi:hypothetical protein